MKIEDKFDFLSPATAWKSRAFSKKMAVFFRDAKNPIKYTVKVKAKEEQSMVVFEGNKEDYTKETEKEINKRVLTFVGASIIGLASSDGKIAMARGNYSLVLEDGDEK
jgi:hypothetical protein